MRTVSTVFAILLLIGAQYIPVVPAAEERPISGKAILELLANSKVKGNGFEQTFADPRGHDSASTTYWEGGSASYGRWRVTGGKYCSQWGNRDDWSCYEVLAVKEASQTRIIWIDTSGRQFEGVLVDKSGGTAAQA